MFEQRGITGYTGYVPNAEIIQVGIKDTTVHTGKVRSNTSEHSKGGLVIDSAPTETLAAFSMTPDMFPKDMSARASGALSPYNPFVDGRSFIPKPFVAESTYRQEMLSGAAKTEQVLAAGEFVGGTVRPEASGVKNVLYETETQQKQAEALQVAAVIRPHVNIGGYEPPPPLPSAKERERLARDFRSIEQAASRAFMDTSYRRSFGGRDFNPRSTIPMATRDLSLKASTREHFAGTPKAVEHVPGYSGFIAAAQGNRRALEHSANVEKPSTKRVLLSELGQYPRSVPGFLGFLPSAFANQAERKRDLTLTTSGRADLAGSFGFKPGELGTSLYSTATVQYTPPTVGVSNSLVSDFFTHAALTVSDNGVHNAEAYYKLLRPLDGRSMAIVKPVSQAPILTNMV
ncbi:hypothetical protein KFE25_008394 [Diacronema lutheri]|uniref:Uncharacterized protein n=1 Tax=Diacronema lutheri TaxID=2081491 RepID=A0A8J5XDE2_DIALT|nr:hypothetical protein KFE25_008394 [Diacronema lutheri]